MCENFVSDERNAWNGNLASNSLNDSLTDTDDDSDLVADVDPNTPIRIVRHKPKNGKAPGIDNVYNGILKKAVGTGFYKISEGPEGSSPLYAHQD